MSYEGPKTTFVGGISPFRQAPQEDQRTLKDRVFDKLQAVSEGLTLEDLALDISVSQDRLLSVLLDAVETSEVECTIRAEGPIYKFVQKLLPPRFDVSTLIGKVEQFISENPGVTMSQIVEAYPGGATRFTIANLKQQGRCRTEGKRGSYKYYVT